MKKIKLFVLLVLFSTYYTFAQQNTFPTNGKVGVGTLTPSARLDVNGKVKIDSMLVVKDSVLIKKSLRVEKEVLMEKGVIIKDNLIVEKNIYLPNIQELTTNGNGNGNGLGLGQNNQNYKLLYIDSNGKIVRGIGNLTPVGDDETDNPCNGLTSTNWFKSGNNLFVECENVNVGINTSNPSVKLDVKGTTYSQKSVLGNLDPTQTGSTLLSIKSPSSFTNSEKIVSISNQNENIFILNNDGLLTTKNIVNNGTFSMNTGLDNSNNSYAFKIQNSFSSIFSIENSGLVTTKNIVNNGTYNMNTGLDNSNNSYAFKIQNSDDQVFSILNNGNTNITGVLNTYQINATHKFFLYTQMNYTDPSVEIFNIYNDNYASLFNIKNTGNIAFNTSTLDYMQYRFKATENIGFELEHIADTDYEQAMYVKVNKDLTRAFGVINNVTGTETMTFNVDGSGKTQIGSGLLNVNHHGAMLTVHGQILAKEIRCTINGWPDYVFEESYQQPKLEEIESYYKKEKHLPGIPSEKELIENGVDLTEMNKLLLQKIEEMTIQMVEMDKRIKTLEKQ
jgi:hypothetical protein